MKDALRTQMREKRQSLSRALYAKKSEAIVEKLKELDRFKEAQKLLIYVSKAEEVDTHDLIRDCLATGRKVYVPKVTGQSLSLCPINHWNELETGAFGVLETCEVLNPEHPAQMDLVVLPGLAFSPSGQRLGYGKGYFDRILKECSGFKIGLAFQEQIVHELPTEAHDVPMDLILTDTSTYKP